jgi:putative drug exporter of the RND superfamily
MQVSGSAVLDRVARSATAAPKFVLSLALLVMAVAGVVGAPAAQKLSTGGFADPDAASTKASRLLADKFHLGGEQLFLLVRAHEGIDTPAPRKFVEQLVAQLRAADEVNAAASPWDSPDPVAAGAISRDKLSALIVVSLKGDESQSAAYSAELARRFTGHHGDDITVSAGGAGVVNAEISDQARRDLSLSEAIALPISFVVLVWVFGGVVAAMIPLTIGCFAILGSMAIIRLLAEVTPVSAFALNVSAGLGLALAIDYSLLIVSRYREEIGAADGPAEALRRTMQTAGRTVTFSAITVGLCLSAMALFPMYALRSLAYGGVAVVILAGLASLIVTPAVIVLTAKRITKGRTSGSRSPNVWYRWARVVMRRPTTMLVVTVIPLLLIASPFRDARLGLPDERILPPTSHVAQLGKQIRADFNRDVNSTVQVVIPDARPLSDSQLRLYATKLSNVPDVSAVIGHDATFVHGIPVGPGGAPSDPQKSSALFNVTTQATPFSDQSRTLLERLHAVSPPANTQVWFGGLEQSNRDSINSIATRLPEVLGAIAVVMFVLLFLLTGSITIPVKALVLNTFSLSATFGAMVWIFQEGHLDGLGTTVGPLLAIVPILLFCVAFGLSMDYEVFLISRMREFWLASDKTRAANDNAVALGIATTGRVVTAAALIMTISFAALIASQVSLIRIFGLGLTLAILLDATVIRMVFLPAAMALLGRWNWWTPRLRRVRGYRDHATASSR